MKFWQFYLILAAIYISPRVSQTTAMVIAAIFSVIGLVTLWRRH